MKAFSAITSSGHTSKFQRSWLEKSGVFFDSNPPVWIIRTEHFEKDFKDFLSKSDLDIEFSDLHIETDETKAHKYNYEGVPPLSDKAIENLRIWYLLDFKFYDLCEEWMGYE